MFILQNVKSYIIYLPLVVSSFSPVGICVSILTNGPKKIFLSIHVDVS